MEEIVNEGFRRIDRAAGAVNDALLFDVTGVGFAVVGSFFPFVYKAGAVYGSYEAGVSAVELRTDKHSGAHIPELLTGSIDYGRELSNEERKLGWIAVISLPLLLKSVRSTPKASSANIRAPEFVPPSTLHYLLQFLMQLLACQKQV